MAIVSKAPAAPGGPAELPLATLPQMLKMRADTDGDRIALLQKDLGIWRPITWRTYHQRARRFALGLGALGLQPGGHVGVLSENRVEWVLASVYCACRGMHLCNAAACT